MQKLKSPAISDFQRRKGEYQVFLFICTIFLKQQDKLALILGAMLDNLFQDD